MHIGKSCGALCGAAVSVLCFGLFGASHAGAAEKVDFASQIQPILKQSCVKCHSLENPRHEAAAGFRLDSRENALKGGKNGKDKDIIPGSGADSVLVKLLHGDQRINGHKIDGMPKAMRGKPFKPLTGTQIDLLKDWIDQGAHWD